MSLPLPNLYGRHQIMNAGTAIATIAAIDDISITREAFVEGIENAPKAFIGLMRGDNFGKLLIKVK